MDSVQIWICGYWPASPNRRLHAHWSTQSRHKRLAMDLLKIACLKQHGRVPRFAAPVSVTLTRYWGRGGRAMDRDNLYGSVKPLLDAMKAERRVGRAGTRGLRHEGGLGIIPDDDPGVCTLLVEQGANAGPDGAMWTSILIQGRLI